MATMQLKEIKNGRLAMLGIGGMAHGKNSLEFSWPIFSSFNDMFLLGIFQIVEYLPDSCLSSLRFSFRLLHHWQGWEEFHAHFEICVSQWDLDMRSVISRLSILVSVACMVFSCLTFLALFGRPPRAPRQLPLRLSVYSRLAIFAPAVGRSENPSGSQWLVQL